MERLKTWLRVWWCGLVRGHSWGYPVYYTPWKCSPKRCLKCGLTYREYLACEGRQERWK